MPMSLTSLKDNFRTGIKGLDYEHRKLVGVMEAICYNFERAAATGTVSGWFGELYAQVSAHFALEEALMRKERYVAFEAHKADHERLLDQIRTMMESYEDGKCADCGLSLRACLEAWFAGHAKEMDAGLRNLSE
jgi:hemerythrin-like metal-binding protein